MKILHTSDWHLGRRLCGRERRDEFQKFLTWLTGVLSEEKIDALIVAGDVFDSFTPPQWAQMLYYDFLTRLSATPCKSAVIVAGNHDSPSLLDAPRELLKRLNVFVTGVPNGEHELCELPGPDGNTGAVCCAVPFLRSRDLCGAMEGMEPDARRAAELEAFAAHYRDIVQRAEQLRAGRGIPIIATGHCFAAGGKVNEGDGVRDLAVGSVDVVPLNAFPDAVDYLALGHLHAPQLCGALPSRRYSGSPLAMGFGEAGRPKEVVIADFGGREPAVRALPVPVWQEIVRLRGTFDEIAARLDELKLSGRPVWAEADCTDQGGAQLCERLYELAPDAGTVRLLLVRAAADNVGGTLAGDGDLNEDWAPQDVFEFYLKEHGIDGDEARELTGAYLEAVAAVREERDEAVQPAL